MRTKTPVIFFGPACILLGSSVVASLWLPPAITDHGNFSQQVPAMAASVFQREEVYTRAFTMSFSGTEMSIELHDGTGNPQIKVSRLQRKPSVREVVFDRFPLSRVNASEPKKQSFRFDSAFNSNEIMPLEITIAFDSEPLTSIAYLKLSRDGKITETTWAEYACAEKLYVCGKDWRGRPAMRLPVKR